MMNWLFFNFLGVPTPIGVGAMIQAIGPAPSLRGGLGPIRPTADGLSHR
jgi:hypothetical protein